MTEHQRCCSLLGILDTVKVKILELVNVVVTNYGE
jgi:hypothetical protein